MTTRLASSLLDGTISNFLSIDEQYFENSIGTWTATNASAIRNIGFRFRETYHTLEITPNSSQSIVLGVEPKEVPVALATDYITFYMFAYCTARTQFQIDITNSGGEAGSETVVANALTWTVIRGPKVPVPRSAFPTEVTLSITASSHGGAKFYIGHPSLVNTLHLADNLFLRQCMAYMPEILIETDRNQTLPDYPLLRILDIATLYANRGVNQYDTFRYRDIASGYKESDPSTKSKLINPDVAETRFLSWLAQIVGVTITQVGGGSTPWGNLPTTWQQFLTAVDDAGDNDDIAEWFEIEGFNVSASNFDASARAQIKTAQTGYKSGLTTSLEIVIETFMTGQKNYKIYTDPIGSPWTILIRTLASETPGGVVGQPTEALVLALNKSKPMGFVIDHQCVSAL